MTPALRVMIPLLLEFAATVQLRKLSGMIILFELVLPIGATEWILISSKTYASSD